MRLAHITVCYANLKQTLSTLLSSIHPNRSMGLLFIVGLRVCFL
jgi:hypothetical protein